MIKTNKNGKKQFEWEIIFENKLKSFMKKNFFLEIHKDESHVCILQMARCKNWFVLGLSLKV